MGSVKSAPPKPNSVTSIGSCAFYGCRGLTSVSIPNSVTSIGNCAFANCSHLQEVEIGSGLKTLPYSGNYNNKEYYTLFLSYHRSNDNPIIPPIEKLRIVDSDKGLSLPDVHIYYSTSRTEGYFSILPLKEVYVGRKLDYGSYSPFSGCEMEKIEIGGCCERVEFGINTAVLILGEKISEVDVFRISETNLTDIYLKAGTPPDMTGGFSNKAYLNINVYVPKGTLEAYQTAEGWKNFWNMMEWEPNTSSVESVKTADQADISVEGRNIYVSSVAAVPVCVYNAGGRMVYQGNDKVVTVAEPGLYVVRAGGLTKKLLVR